MARKYDKNFNERYEDAQEAYAHVMGSCADLGSALLTYAGFC